MISKRSTRINNTNKRLKEVLLGLLGILAMAKLLSPKTETNITKEYAALETASIYEIAVEPAGEKQKAMQLIRNEEGWKIIAENKQAWAADDVIHELLVSTIRP